MSQAVANFMRDWVLENVNFVGYPPEDGVNPEADHLATRCLIDADAAGISKQTLEAEFGDLSRFMNGELVRMADEEVAAKVAKSD